MQSHGRLLSLKNVALEHLPISEFSATIRSGNAERTWGVNFATNLFDLRLVARYCITRKQSIDNSWTNNCRGTKNYVIRDHFLCLDLIICCWYQWVKISILYYKCREHYPYFPSFTCFGLELSLFIDCIRQCMAQWLITFDNCWLWRTAQRFTKQISLWPSESLTES